MALENEIRSLSTKFEVFRQRSDYHLFSILCMKYFFFSEGKPFDPELVDSYIVDGSNDGGIDAVFNDPNSENNDMIVVQSKYYNSTELTQEIIAGDLAKTKKTLDDLKNFHGEAYNENMKSAYTNADNAMEDDGKIKICFFTSYNPKNTAQKNKLEKAFKKAIEGYEGDIYFLKDIQNQIEMCDNGKVCVDEGKLNIDKVDNFLCYGDDAVIVNISALSLQNLYLSKRNGLLGLNLRYYVRSKDVDSGIADTIHNYPNEFWYRNNGLVIICNDFQIDGKEIKLKDFSIINGGQTTNRIGNLDIAEDFYIQCKVIKSKGNTDNDKFDYTRKIAQATNSQKPIRKSDTLSTERLQINLKSELNKNRIYYITKRGDKVNTHQYTESWQTATIEDVGKVSLAGIMLLPGSARSNSKKMFDDNYYNSIFCTNNAVIIKDLLKINSYYETFRKKLKDFSFGETYNLPMARNGKTFQIAIISFLKKINLGLFCFSDFSRLESDEDKFKLLKKVDNFTRIISNTDDPNEERKFFLIFKIIINEILGYSFRQASNIARSNGKVLDASNYLKSDKTFTNDIIEIMQQVYEEKEDDGSDSKLKQLIDSL